MSIITDQQVPNNRPDIMLLEKENKELTIIDVSIPVDDNIGRAYKEKIDKYEALSVELKRVWNLKTLPIIITANGLIHKNLPDILRRLGLRRSVFVLLQKAAILGTTAIVRRFLSR